MQKLYALYSRRHGAKSDISPSALNAYLDCSLRFYFRYIAGLKEPDEVTTEIDSAMFGSIFHRTVELMYRKLTAANPLVRKEDIEGLLKNERLIKQLVDYAFKELFFHISPQEKSEYNGTQLINANVIATYVRQLLNNDLRYAPFEMVDMEHRVFEDLTLHTTAGEIEVRIGGIIDRIDRKDGVLRIVDYKTGGVPKTPANVEELFHSSAKRPGYVFQTFLYAAIMCRKQTLAVAPSLLYIHRAASDSYSPVIEMGEPRQPKLQVDDFSVYEGEFRRRLQDLLEELYNPDVPFTQTNDEDVCAYCDFKRICRG
jgi:ATP-dependent helicase/DNAse subunit B